MKIKVIDGTDNSIIGNVYEVEAKLKNHYGITVNGYAYLLLKVNAEVVEEVEKSCENCGQPKDQGGYCSYDCNRSHKYWQPIESEGLEIKPAIRVNKHSCNDCQFNVDRPTSKCVPYCHTYCHNWQPQTEIVTNEHGGKQSKTEYLWTDFCPNALLRVAKLSHAGCQKYGVDNWKKISKLDHIGHAITHMFKYLAGCKDEDHLAHACWRVLAAMGVEG